MIRPDAAPLSVEPSAPATLAPRPRDLAEAGLSELYVADLISKHLFERGVLDLQELARCVALSGGLLEPCLLYTSPSPRDS